MVIPWISKTNTRLRLHAMAARMVVFSLALAACGAGQSAKTTTAVGSAPSPAAITVRPDVPGVLLRVTPRDAEVIVDGRSFGRVSDLDATGGVIELSSGFHQITVTKPGYKTWRAEVAVRDRLENLDVVLEAAVSP